MSVQSRLTKNGQDHNNGKVISSLDFPNEYFVKHLENVIFSLPDIINVKITPQFSQMSKSTSVWKMKHSSAQFSDDTNHHAPNTHLRALRNNNRRKMPIFRTQSGSLIINHQALDRQIIVYHSYHNLSTFSR